MQQEPQREALLTRVPPSLARSVEARAQANRRSVSAELQVLLEYACASMPVPVYQPEER